MPNKLNPDMNPGTRWANLTVIERGPNGGRMPRVYCLCDCGTKTLVYVCSLRTGNTKSCGCLRGESHGLSGRRLKGEIREYRIWCHAKGRCQNPKDPKYPAYGGRGIRMCDAWENSFTAFLADMGRSPPGLTLDRIDVNGNYEPGNCRWATWEVQRKNRRPSTEWKRKA
jgi:hypothetical protein